MPNRDVVHLAAALTPTAPERMAATESVWRTCQRCGQLFRTHGNYDQCFLCALGVTPESGTRRGKKSRRK